MDGVVNKPGEGGKEGAGGYIWLRYTTQFSAGGRTHTIEMGIPMPLGASDEMCEQLLREAETGMNRLAEHVERRVSQVVRRAQSPTPPAPAPVAQPAPPPKAISKPAAESLASTPSQPARSASLPVRETEPERAVPTSGEAAVPPTRATVGASMPSMPGGAGDSGVMTVGDFVSYIRKNFNLDPQQAMKLLNVRTLQGINLRQAVTKLQAILTQGAGERTEPDEARPANISPIRPVNNTSPSRPPTSTAAPASAPSSPKTALDEPERKPTGAVHEERPVFVFDEEVGPDDLEDLEDLDDLEMSRELMAQERGKAESLVKKLREIRGASTASSNRLRVLDNVVLSQISEQQLLELIGGVWGTTTLKKLKVDQAEELISWAKNEDDFVNQVEAILALLEEER